MSSITVRKGNKTKVSANFTQDEFAPNSSDLTQGSFEVDEALILGKQYLRDLFGIYRMHGTARSKKHNKRVGGAEGSKHLELYPIVAGDGSFKTDNASKIAKIADDIENQGSIYEDLKYMGITGVGFYDWGIHMDSSKTRNGFTVWDNRTKKKKNLKA